MDNSQNTTLVFPYVYPIHICFWKVAPPPLLVHVVTPATTAYRWCDCHACAADELDIAVTTKLCVFWLPPWVTTGHWEHQCKTKLSILYMWCFAHTLIHTLSLLHCFVWLPTGWLYVLYNFTLFVWTQTFLEMAPCLQKTFKTMSTQHLSGQDLNHRLNHDY